MLERGTNRAGTMTDERPTDRSSGHRSSTSARETENVSELADEARSSTRPFTTAAMFVAGAAMAAAVALLVAQNTEPTTVEWWAWDPTGPMWIVLALTFVAGTLTGPLLAGCYVLLRTRARHRAEHIDELARASRPR
jgi:uncharacterized integral membrane protein